MASKQMSMTSFSGFKTLLGDAQRSFIICDEYHLTHAIVLEREHEGKIGQDGDQNCGPT